MVPNLWIEEHGRIGELALGRTALVAVALALLTVRGQDVKGGHLLGRIACGRGLRIPLSTCVLSLSGERSRSSYRYRSRRDRLRSSDRYRSRRHRPLSPACRGARGHAIFRVVLVTACGFVDDYLPPLIVRDQGRKDGEPNESSRRVWRW